MRTIPLLKANDIEIKVKQVTSKGAIVLLYKTARVDMAILDAVYGAENWTCDYKEIKGNLYCGIGVRERSTSTDFVWKWDCGIESREDKEGNEKKGEASDAFKRAAVKWGIGRELYTAPFIFVSLETEKNDKGGGYQLKNQYLQMECAEITYDENRAIASLVIEDDKGNILYPLKGHKRTEKRKDDDFDNTPPSMPKTEPKTEIDEDVINDIWFYAQEAGQTDNIEKWINKKFGKPVVEALTVEEANILITALREIQEGKTK